MTSIFSTSEIISLDKQGKGYKKISKALNVPRDTVGSIVRKIKVEGTVAESESY